MIVGGAANLGGKSAFGMVRFGPDRRSRHDLRPNGQVVTPFGAPAINGYVTGLGVTGNFVVASGRLTDPAGLATVAARYYATGTPPPPLPPPAASTQGVDQITTTSARVSGTVNTNHSEHVVGRVRHHDGLRCADRRAAARRLDR